MDVHYVIGTANTLSMRGLAAGQACICASHLTRARQTSWNLCGAGGQDTVDTLAMVVSRCQRLRQGPPAVIDLHAVVGGVTLMRASFTCTRGTSEHQPCSYELQLYFIAFSGQSMIMTFFRRSNMPKVMPTMGTTFMSSGVRPR